MCPPSSVRHTSKGARQVGINVKERLATEFGATTTFVIKNAYQVVNKC